MSPEKVDVARTPNSWSQIAIPCFEHKEFLHTCDNLIDFSDFPTYSAKGGHEWA